MSGPPDPAAPGPWLSLGVGLIALCTLALEVTLTRIFAVTLWYHFGFLAISLALLGTAASAVMCFAYPERLAGLDHARTMAWSAAGFALAVPLSVFVHLALPLPSPQATGAFYLLFALQLLALFCAFLLAGLSISIALYRYAARIGTLYFFDLAGAALGSVLVVPALFQVSALALTFGVSGGACLAAAAFFMASAREPRHEARPRGRRAASAMVVCAIGCFVLLAINDSLPVLTIDTVKSYAKGNVQEREEPKVLELWSPVSRVAVFKSQRARDGWVKMKVTNDAGAPTFLHRFEGDFASVRPLIARDARQVVHAIKQNASVLVIGSAGGMDVLVSLAMNQARITAVEINPVIGFLVRGPLAGYIGNIFEDPRVRLHIQEGRNFAAGSSEDYDIIQITMIDSWGGAAAGAYVFNENALYTYEGVRDYYEHLKPGGVLSMTRYLHWDESLRLTATYVQLLRDMGLSEIPRRVIAIAERKKGYRRATVLLKNGLFTPDEARAVAKAARIADGAVIWAPYLDPRDFMRGAKVQPYRDLILSDSRAAYQRVLDAYPQNVAPSTDDVPFFFFTTRLRDLFTPRPDHHPARRAALPLLYAMLATFALLAFVTVFLPLRLRAGAEIASAPFRRRLLLYFAMLGVGFMLIELSLIQRLTVFLGHPIWSFVVVLATVLAAGGIGSYTSNRLARVEHLQLVLAAVVVLVLGYAWLVYDRLIDLMYLSRSARIAVAAAVAAPIGFVLGMCFPMGMQLAQRVHRSFVPWGWGVNGAFSVFASILSIVLALNVGFRAALCLGAGCYAVAFLVISSMRRGAPGP